MVREGMIFHIFLVVNCEDPTIGTSFVIISAKMHFILFTEYKSMENSSGNSNQTAGAKIAMKYIFSKEY